MLIVRRRRARRLLFGFLVVSRPVTLAIALLMAHTAAASTFGQVARAPDSTLVRARKA